MGKTLYIIDGHWQIYRAYYAPFRDLSTPAGEPTKATLVFNTMLLKLITEHRPDYLAVVMDSPREQLARTKLYADYKAQRAAAPEDLAPQVRRIVQIIEALQIPLIRKVGSEADDIIATLARRLASEDLRVVLVSRDKDLEQLLGPNIVMFDPMKDEYLDPAKLVEVKGYPPEKAVEVQSLCGDDSDNVPGVPGVGVKTAAKLISQYGTAQGVLEHASELTPKLAENVRNSAATIALARQLVTLHDNVELDQTLEQLTFHGLRVESLKAIYRELDFRRLVEQLDKLDASLVHHEQAPAAVATPAGRTTAKDFKYCCVDTPEELDKLVARLAGVKQLAVDTETTSVQPVCANLVGISLAWCCGEAVYIPVKGPLGATTLDIHLVREKLGPILADPSIQKIGHHLKYDIIVLERAAMPLGGPMFDTMLAAYVLHADKGSYRLDAVAEEFLNHRAIPIADLIGSGKHARTMDAVPCDVVTPYACEDADLTFKLADLLRGKLQQENLLGLFEDMEMALMPVLVKMEQTGIKVDRGALDRQRIVLSKLADELRTRIIVAAGGREFNVDSPRQLAAVLFEQLGLPVLRKNASGPSTDSAVLVELAELHEVPGLILDYRQVAKLLGTYLVALGGCIDDNTGRVHTSFHQTGTATGRLSSSDPNLQNIPVRSEMGKNIRSAFVADNGNVLVSADYSQVELRVLAHFCQDPTLMAAFEGDQDIHRIVAAEVFRVAAEDVTPQQRARAKTVNFGIIYGQTAFGLAQTLRIPRGEAQDFITAYKARFPRIEEFLRSCVAAARRQGYVETLSGRRRRIEGFDSANPQKRALAERLAINSVVQGSAADLIKLAMINVDARLAAEHRPARMLLQIHDELLFETPAPAVDDDSRIIREEMTRALTLRVPLKVDIGVGPNWRDAKS